MKLLGVMHRLQYVKRVQPGSRLGNGVGTHRHAHSGTCVGATLLPSITLPGACLWSVHLHHPPTSCMGGAEGVGESIISIKGTRSGRW